MASSTVALATLAILRSVAGSTTSKRPLSEDLRHLPPIHRSVGTLARRFSYMTLPLHSSFRGGAQRRTRNPDASSISVSGFRVRAFGAPRNDRNSTIQRPPHCFCNARRRRQYDVFEIVGGGQRDVRRGDAHRRA